MTTSILLVDDDPAIAPLVQSATKGRDWNFDLVPDGRTAMNAIPKNKPRLIITDLEMPEMGGLELTRHVVQHHTNIPIVVLTGKGSEDSAIDCFRAGAADYIRKENLKRDLVGIVARLLDEEAEADELAGQSPPIAPLLDEPSNSQNSHRMSRRRATRAVPLLCAIAWKRNSSFADGETPFKAFTPNEPKTAN